MASYPHKLHPPVVTTDAHVALVARQLRALVAPPAVAPPIPATPPPSIQIALTTVSLAGNFDAYINIQFSGQATGAPTSLLVDSGNSMLIVPYWEDIQNNPAYQVLGQASEPWGSPANVVQGPILIPTVDGGTYTLPNCIFYACTGGARTANFGAGNIQPWSASGWNTPLAGVTMQAPLSYNTAYPFAEIHYATAAQMFTAAATPTVASGSFLTVYQTQPQGYTMLDIIQDLEWMSVRPQSLSIGQTVTGWPGQASPSIAMVDTGGGPVFLSDPNGYVYDKTWPDPATCPTWAGSSTNCTCISDQLGLTLTDGETSFSYTIDTAALPAPVQGLTAVMCENNAYMMGQYGMNIGGITALFNDILIDYGGTRIGFQATAAMGARAGA